MTVSGEMTLFVIVEKSGILYDLFKIFKKAEVSG